ncbi:MAG: hypothetical protein FJ121_08965 [Deltaproteobacteria bacterium]|nr:hypothetical protein [Deltaproteobacteria bacterium]
MAAGDLTTLSNLRAWLNLTTDAADTLLARLITAVSAFIQGPEALGYQVPSQNYSLVLNGHGGDVLVLGRPPLTAVASLVIDGVTILPASTSTAYGYRFSPSAVWLKGYVFTRGRGNVELACTRGYAATPADLEQAALELIGVRFKERDHIGQDAATMSGQNITFSTRDMPASVKTVLQAYKKVAPV